MNFPTATDVRNAQRIAIIGNRAAGKSTLAARLGQILERNVVHGDMLHFDAHWNRVPIEKIDLRAREESKKNNWIYESAPRKNAQYFFRKCDVLIWLDYNFFLRLKFFVKRNLIFTFGPDHWRPFNKPRPWYRPNLVQFFRTNQRVARKTKRTYAKFEHRKVCFRLTNTRDVDAFTKSLT